MATITLRSPAETFAWGQALAPELAPGDVLALVGPLGAGKTQLVKGLAAGLGAEPEGVSSPTFTLVQEYGGGRLPLYHLDWYRLEHAEEVLGLGWDELLDGGGVLAVEWADKFPTLLPRGTRRLTLLPGEGELRSLGLARTP